MEPRSGRRDSVAREAKARLQVGDLVHITDERGGFAVVIAGPMNDRAESFYRIMDLSGQWHYMYRRALVPAMWGFGGPVVLS